VDNFFKKCFRACSTFAGRSKKNYCEIFLEMVKGTLNIEFFDKLLNNRLGVALPNWPLFLRKVEIKVF